MTSDFSRWDTSAPPASGWLPFPAHPILVGMRTVALTASLSIAGLGFWLWMIWNRRSRLVYAAVVGVVLFSMIVTPQLQSHKIYALAQEQDAQAVEREIAQSENDAERETQLILQRPTFAAHVNPLTQAQLRQAAQNGTLPASPGDDPGTLIDPTLSTGVDTDGDGLEDATEWLLDTDPQLADTDGDLLSDAQEVGGFTGDDGSMWYTDPRALDTNKDGRPDGLECTAMWEGEATCNDLDDDGAPDVWDYDDDNDDVPDTRDLSHRRRGRRAQRRWNDCAIA